MSVLSGQSGDSRCGLQIAEVPRTGSMVDGPGVETAVRLAERAAPGQLLVAPALATVAANRPTNVCVGPAVGRSWRTSTAKTAATTGLVIVAVASGALRLRR